MKDISAETRRLLDQLVEVEEKHGGQLKVEIAFPTREALRRLGTSAENGLIEALNAPNTVKRRLAAQYLGEIGSGAAFAPLQFRLVFEADAGVQASIRSAFARLEYRGEKQTTSLHNYVAVLDNAALQSILSAVDDSTPQVRKDIIHTLGYAQPDNPDVVRLVRDATHDSDDSVRQVAIEILGSTQLQVPDVLAYLIEATEDDSPAVCKAAVMALGKNESGDARIAPALVATAKRFDDVELRQKTLEVLTSSDHPDAIALCLNALEDTDLYTTAVSNLQAYGSQNLLQPETLMPVTHLLERLLATEDISFRDIRTLSQIATVLGHIGDPAAIPVLEKLATLDPPRDRKKLIQRNAADAISQLAK